MKYIKGIIAVLIVCSLAHAQENRRPDNGPLFDISQGYDKALITAVCFGFTRDVARLCSQSNKDAINMPCLERYMDDTFVQPLNPLFANLYTLSLGNGGDDDLGRYTILKTLLNHGANVNTRVNGRAFLTQYLQIMSRPMSEDSRRAALEIIPAILAGKPDIPTLEAAKKWAQKKLAPRWVETVEMVKTMVHDVRLSNHVRERLELEVEDNPRVMDDHWVAIEQAIDNALQQARSESTSSMPSSSKEQQ